LVDPLLRSGADEDNIDPKEDEKKDGRDQKKGFDLQGRFPFIGIFKNNYRGKNRPSQPNNFIENQIDNPLLPPFSKGGLGGFVNGLSPAP
jgi:hypothetical protein